MLKKTLIICALIICSTQLFSQEKWKVTSVDTSTFKNYNFIKISLMEAKTTKYLVSSKTDPMVIDKTKVQKIKKGDLLDIDIVPAQSVYTLELSGSTEPQSYKIRDSFITRNDTVQVDLYTSSDIIDQYVKIK